MVTGTKNVTELLLVTDLDSDDFDNIEILHWENKSIFDNIDDYKTNSLAKNWSFDNIILSLSCFAYLWRFGCFLLYQSKTAYLTFVWLLS